MTEVWKSVVGYEGFYEVSNMGRVKSLARFVGGKGGSLRPIPECIKKTSVNRCGYEKIQFSDGVGRKYHTVVHRVVAGAFLENPHNKAQINHIDGDKLNNSVDNLEWATSFENQRHAVELTRRYGERTGTPKLKEADIVDVRFLIGNGVRQYDVAKLYDVSRMTIYRVMSGRNWKRVA